jgi:glycosyltransferase involved in cell wall biosynthesis
MPGVDHLQRESDAGHIPRKDYVELARRYGVDIIDSDYLARRASSVARVVARRAGTNVGQLVEVLVHGSRYDSIWTWDDSVGLPLALAHKLGGRRTDLVNIAAWISRPKKAVFLRPLGAHTSIRAIVSGSRAQLDYAAERLRVPRSKLHFVPWPVDDRFWRPAETAAERMICAVGWEARDYGTLLKAARHLDVDVRLAIGSHVLSWDGNAGTGDVDGHGRLTMLHGTVGYRRYRIWMREVEATGFPPNVSVDRQMAPVDLRDLYQRAQLVVVPLHDVDSDCGITVVIEAMAMGKAVIVTRTRGQVDVFEDGIHGLYVPPHDPDALGTAIDRLLRNPAEADRMGRAARELALRRHALDGYVEQLATFLKG